MLLNYLIKLRYNYFFISFAFTSLLFFILINTFVKDVSKFSFEIKSKISGNVHVYINNFSSPHMFQVKENENKIIVVDNLTQDIKLLRIDPPKTLNNIVEIKNLFFKNKNEIFHKIKPEKVITWGKKDIKFTNTNSNQLEFQVIGNDPYFLTGEKIAIDTEFKIVNILLDMVNKYKPGSLLISLLCLFFLSAEFFRINYSYKIVISILFIMSSCYLIFNFILSFNFGFSPVHTTIGRAVYNGLSNSPNLLSIFMSLIVVLLVSFFIRIRTNQLIFSQTKMENNVNFNQRTTAIFVLFISAFLLLTPNLLLIVQTSISNGFSKDWDSNNINTWKYMINDGLLPFKDFWYPYGGRSIFYINSPYGDIFLWIYKTLIYGSLGTSLYILFQRKLYIYIIIISILIYGEETKLFWGASRYLLSFTVCLSYLCINSSHNFFSTQRLLFWINGCMVLFFEPTLIIYSAPAILFIIILDCFVIKNTYLALKKLFVDFFPLLIFTLIILFFAESNGFLLNLIEFYINIKDQAIISSEPANLLGDPLKIILVMSPFFAITVGVLHFSNLSLIDRNFQISLISIGLIGIILLTKHQVRSMDWQLFILPNIILIIFYLYLSRVQNKFTMSILGICFGLIMIFFNNHNYVDYLVNKTKNLSNMIHSNYDLFATDSNLIKELNDSQYSQEKFTSFKNELNLVYFLKAKINENEKVYVLNDNSILYVLLDQKPPYNINLYNASAVYSQKQNVNWLKNNDPKFIIWDKTKKNFDLIPNIVRSPIIYEYIVKNYSFYKSVAGFDLLIKNLDVSSMDKEYWKNNFTKKINLGFIPGASNIKKDKECFKYSNKCRPVLSIKTTKSVKTQDINLTLHFDDQIVEILLEVKSDYFNYDILVDRLLFWWLLDKKPKKIKIKVNNNNFTSDFNYFEIPSNILY